MDEVMKFYLRCAHTFAHNIIFCCQTLPYIVNANKMLKMGEAWERSYELVIHDTKIIILPCAQTLGQYVTSHEIPGEGG